MKTPENIPLYASAAATAGGILIGSYEVVLCGAISFLPSFVFREFYLNGTDKIIYTDYKGDNFPTVASRRDLRDGIIAPKRIL